MATGQCKSVGITVATLAPANGANNVAQDKEDSADLHYHICKSYSMLALEENINCYLELVFNNLSS